MRAALVVVVVLLGVAAATEAQPRTTLSVTMAAESGDRGNIPGGAVPVMGALIGLQLAGGWSLEVEVDRGFRTTTAGSGEAVIVSFPPTTTPTRAEIEQYGIRARSERQQVAGFGWSAHAAWRSRQPRRVNIGFLAGLSSRVHTSRLIRTTTFVSPLLDLPPTYRLPDENSTRRLVGGGITGGLLVLVRITNQLTIAPELRLTTGLITDDPYRVFRSGVRTTWSF